MTETDVAVLTKVLQMGNGGIVLGAIYLIKRVLDSFKALDDKVDKHDQRISFLEGIRAARPELQDREATQPFQPMRRPRG